MTHYPSLMRTILRAGWTLASLVAALIVAGCGTTPTAQIRRPQLSGYSIRVVQSSGTREISGRELEQLRLDVIKFLESQNLELKKSYFVEINLKPDAPSGQEEIMVVLLADESASTYRLLASYSAPEDDYHYYDYGYGSRSDYAPSFLYGYYDPFGYYYGGGSYPPTPPGGYLPRAHRPHDGHRPDDGRRTADNDDRRAPGAKPNRPAGGDDFHPPGDSDRHNPGEGNHRPPPPRPAPRRDDPPPSRPRPEYASNGDSHRWGDGGGTAPSGSRPVSGSGSSSGKADSPPSTRNPDPTPSPGRDPAGPNQQPAAAK